MALVYYEYTDYYFAFTSTSSSPGLHQKIQYIIWLDFTILKLWFSYWCYGDNIYKKKQKKNIKYI